MRLRLIALAFLILINSCSTNIKGPNYNVGSSHNQTNKLRSRVISQEVNRNRKNTKKLRNRKRNSRIASKAYKMRSKRFNNKRYIN
jgi:hypothetical protein